MLHKKGKKGSAFLITIFMIALMSAVVMGMLQMSTEELQIVHNQVFLAQAVATAEAGLNDAFAELRDDSSWTDGFTNKSFEDDTYTVSVSGTLPNLTIISAATTAEGYQARVEADITVGTAGPHTIRIDHYRINE